MFKDLWKSYSVPIVASGLGLLVVLALGIAPLIQQSAPRPAAAAPAPTVSADPGPQGNPSDLAALQSSLSAQTRALDSLGNRLTTLEKGITRLNARVRAQGDQMDAMASVPRDLNRAISEVAIMNKAVPRIHNRLLNQTNAVEILPDLKCQLVFLEGQMRILNTAVPRLQSCIKALQAKVGD